MTIDAKFEDGSEKPLNIGAFDVDDLKIFSSLVQDSIFPITEMQWDTKAHRFGLLLNRFRWESVNNERFAPERVQTLLVFNCVLSVSSRAIDINYKKTVCSLLSVSFEMKKYGAGDVLLTLSGDGSIRLSVETIEATLKDVTRPYSAPSKAIPHHDD